MPECTKEERDFLDHLKKQWKTYETNIGVEFDDQEDAIVYFIEDLPFESTGELEKLASHYAEA